MSGERVEAMRRRARSFLELARELLARGATDLASFHVHQACQLRLKAALLRLRGEAPRTHGIRELTSLLADALDELGHGQEAERLRQFARGHRGILTDIEDAYTESRYGLAAPPPGHVERMLKAAEALLSLLDDVEGRVLG